MLQEWILSEIVRLNGFRAGEVLILSMDVSVALQRVFRIKRFDARQCLFLPFYREILQLEDTSPGWEEVTVASANTAEKKWLMKYGCCTRSARTVIGLKRVRRIDERFRNNAEELE